MVLLHHTLTGGSHYDWLLEHPTTPPGGLLEAVRLPQPADRWLAVGTMLAVALPPHRRRYLRFQGSLSGRRGRVLRIDRGRCQPLLWTDHRRLLTVTTTLFHGLVHWTRLGAERWRLASLSEDTAQCRFLGSITDRQPPWPSAPTSC